MGCLFLKTTMFIVFRIFSYTRTMIQGLVQIFIFQALGELLSKFALPFIPGPVHCCDRWPTQSFDEKRLR